MTLTFAIFRTASAQDIELLVAPGDVIEGHVEFESECSSCHKFFDKAGQRQLCMDCHEDVASDVDSRSGYHGLQRQARSDQCKDCHTDHEGRSAKIVILDEGSFDHDFTDFELLDAHLEIKCGDCHATGEKHRDAANECVDCHVEDDIHETVMGTDCSACHLSTEWPDGKFDHDITDFPLLGKHRENECLDCHEDHTFQDAPADCYGCHAEDDAHDGRSGKDCARCHNPTDWTDASFDHARDTNFPLEGKHAQATCDDCHSEDPFSDTLETECVSCHLEDDHHDGHNGDQCGNCHNNSAWTEPLFDHGTDTGFSLNGAHKDVACVDCHVEPIFEAQLETTCAACHLDDDVHESALGTQCANCHTEVNWQDPVFFDHDLTRFPLLGSHSEPECEDCHASQVFTEEEPDCISCHDDDDPHRGNFHERCDSCHNPVAWDLWQFDHDTQTELVLEGVHANVACMECHRMTLEAIKSMDGNCSNCHRSDDAHDGEFGDDCGRCHSADSFTEVRTLQ